MTRDHNSAKKSVSFSLAQQPPFPSKVMSGTTMPLSEISACWYTASELDNFKTEVRDLSRYFLLAHSVANQQNSETHVAQCCASSSVHAVNLTCIRSPTAEAAPNTKNRVIFKCPRGIEHRISIERQRNKHIAIQAVLECQRRLKIRDATVDVVGKKHPVLDAAVYLSLVSQKCTRSARELALSTGKLDFREAYAGLVARIEEYKRRKHEAVKERQQKSCDTLLLKRRMASDHHAGVVRPRLAPTAEIEPSSSAASTTSTATLFVSVF